MINGKVELFKAGELQRSETVNSGLIGNEVKKVIYIIIIFGSISVCFLGIRSNVSQAHQRKIDYAATTIKSESVKIKYLNNELSQFYQKDQSEFLVEPVDEEKLKKLEQAIDILKTDARDFGLKPEDFFGDATGVHQGKTELVQKLENIKDKLDIQKQISPLLFQTPVDWSAGTSEIIIKETASESDILQVRNKVSTSEDRWSTAMVGILNELLVQVKHYTELKQSIDEMSEGELLTSMGTLDNLLLNLSELDQIKNETMRKELSDQLDEVDQLLEKQMLGEEINEQVEY